MRGLQQVYGKDQGDRQAENGRLQMQELGIAFLPAIVYP